MKKAHTEMIEGPEAWGRFKSAMRAIVKVPKSALPPNPFGKRALPKRAAGGKRAKAKNRK